MFKIMYYIIAFLIATVSLLSQTTLNDYLKIAAENNPALKAKFNEYMSDVQKVTQEKAYPEPQFAFGYFVSPVETRVGPQRMKFSLSQRFPWFGKLEARADSRAEFAKSKFKEFEELKYKLFYDVKKYWYSIYIKEREIELIEEQLMFYQTLESFINVQFQSGKSAMSDLMRIKIKINQLKNRISELNYDLEPLKAGFNALLNRPADSTVYVSDTIESDFLDDTAVNLDSILLHNPRLDVLAQRKTAALSSMKAADKERFPDISLGLDYTVIGERTDAAVAGNGNDAFLPKLSLSIPLFNPKYDAQVNEFSYKADMIEFQMQDYKNTLSADYEKILADYKNALRNIDYLKLQIEDSKKVLSLLYTEYTTSGNKFLDLILEQEKIIIYEFRLEKEKVRQNLAVALIYMLNSQF